MTFEEFLVQEPGAFYFEFLDEKFPVIPSGTFGRTFNFDGGIGGLSLYGPSDYNNITVKGDVGFIVNDDGWWNVLDSDGHVDFINVLNSIGTSVTAWSAGLVTANNSSMLEFSFTTADQVVWKEVDSSTFSALFTGGGESYGDRNTIDIGLWADSAYITGDSNQLTGGYLFDGGFVGDGNTGQIAELGFEFYISGENNRLAIGETEGANIDIDANSSNTRLEIGDGDAFVFDNGESTMVRADQGNLTVIASGDGVSMYNAGGAGQDVIIDEDDGTDIISNFEFVQVDTEGDVIVLDGIPEELLVNVGGENYDGNDLMQVFGRADGTDAVLDFNGGGSLTLVGAAEEFGLQDNLLFV